MNTKNPSLFVQTADCGNISRAGEQLDMATAAASTFKIAGIQLVIRSTR